MEKFLENYTKFYNDVKSITTVDFVQPKDPFDFFVKNWFPHMEQVSLVNFDFFSSNTINPNIFEDLQFLDLMKVVSAENKIIVWEYLHTLYALAIFTKKLKDYDDVDIKKSVDNFDTYIKNIVAWKKSMRKPLPKLDEKLAAQFENSSLAKLAKEISDEIRPEDIMGQDFKNLDPSKLLKSLMAGETDNGVGKLMTTVCDKIKNKVDSGQLNQEDLLKEATTLMQQMSGNPGLANMMGMMGGGAGATGMPDMNGMMNLMKMAEEMGGMFEKPKKERRRKK